jgi:hypothetical protein
MAEPAKEVLVSRPWRNTSQIRDDVRSSLPASHHYRRMSGKAAQYVFALTPPRLWAQ